MATTTRGIIYPTSSDNIAPLETHFANLASSTNTALDTIASTVPAATLAGSTSFTGPATTGASVSVPVTFGSTLSAAPKVTVTVQGGSSVSPYAVAIAGSPSTGGFTATVYRIAGTTAESLVLNWMAKV